MMYIIVAELVGIITIDLVYVLQDERTASVS